MSLRRILVPRLLDADNINAQNLNARALLSRFSTASVCWQALVDEAGDPAVLRNPLVEAEQLWSGRAWQLRHWLFYLQRADALFYPGREAVDARALRAAKWLYPRRPVIATLEGLAGTPEREAQLSEWAGHRVYCQQVSAEVMTRVDGILGSADHVIALSPFLANMGRRLYGDKFSVLPLGVDGALFRAGPVHNSARPRVVSAGRVAAHKRPELFLALAQQHPSIDFYWYGDGDQRFPLLRRARELGLGNVDFPGSLQASELAAAFRAADLFVMPSRSEGVPKVTQEAAACGLPVVLFGYFEAPSVVDGLNGFVVWDDKTFFERIAQLLCEPELRRQQRDAALALAAAWDWDTLAPQWESAVLMQVDRLTAAARSRR
jgi:glycosyltransferase involved in cell wall biosynthesis